MKNENAKHTPGPWVINEEDGICIDARLPDGRFIARVEADESGSAEDGYIPYSEGKANAALISVAPDMYEILNEVEEASRYRRPIKKATWLKVCEVLKKVDGVNR